jgi:lysozyme family protein
MSFFDAAFAIVVGEEGSYVNDSNDRGGERKFGISKRAYPNVDIPQLTLDEARAIYLRDYWDKCGCEVMSWELGLITFDAAVNQGQGFAPTLTAG